MSDFTSDFATRVQALRPELLRYARHQLRQDTWAEDAVSETVLAALERPQAFQGGSQLKTWLVGILKHKVIDQIRRHRREFALPSRDDADESQDLDELLFHPDGHWREMPADWGQPGPALQQRQFLTVLDACIERLPGQQGRISRARRGAAALADVRRLRPLRPPGRADARGHGKLAPPYGASGERVGRMRPQRRKKPPVHPSFVQDGTAVTRRNHSTTRPERMSSATNSH